MNPQYGTLLGTHIPMLNDSMHGDKRPKPIGRILVLVVIEGHFIGLCVSRQRLTKVVAILHTHCTDNGFQRDLCPFEFREIQN